MVKKPVGSFKKLRQKFKFERDPVTGKITPPTGEHSLNYNLLQVYKEVSKKEKELWTYLEKKKKERQSKNKKK